MSCTAFLLSAPAWGDNRPPAPPSPFAGADHNRRKDVMHMPYNDYEPDWEDLAWEDPDPYEDVRYERPLSTREAMDSFMRSFFPEDHLDDVPYETPSEIIQDIIDEEEMAERAAAVDPEKKAAFHAVLARCRAYVKPFGGRIEVGAGYDPNYMDIHIYINATMFHHADVPDFLLDLGRATDRLMVNRHEEVVHIQISLPFYTRSH